jgi:hypothetical protein
VDHNIIITQRVGWKCTSIVLGSIASGKESCAILISVGGSLVWIDAVGHDNNACGIPSTLRIM